jgi:hypothetical protein
MRWGVCNMETLKRGRGRPAGSKDSKPRVYRSKLAADDDGKPELLTVEDKIRALTSPVRLSTLAEISGLSEAVLRKKVQQGKIRAFKRSGIVLIEPKDFLSYWLGGVDFKPVVNHPRLFDRKPLNIN